MSCLVWGSVDLHLPLWIPWGQKRCFLHICFPKSNYHSAWHGTGVQWMSVDLKSDSVSFILWPSWGTAWVVTVTLSKRWLYPPGLSALVLSAFMMCLYIVPVLCQKQALWWYIFSGIACLTLFQVEKSFPDVLRVLLWNLIMKIN